MKRYRESDFSSIRRSRVGMGRAPVDLPRKEMIGSVNIGQHGEVAQSLDCLQQQHEVQPRWGGAAVSAHKPMVGITWRVDILQLALRQFRLEARIGRFMNAAQTMFLHSTRRAVIDRGRDLT